MSRLHKNKEYLNTSWTIEKVDEEINSGLQLLNQVSEDIVTFFGSHIVKPGSEYYEHCRKVAFELGKRGYAIMTGGGPGVMHAANTGARQAGAKSIGLRASLLKGEETSDDIYDHKLPFHFLFVRRFIMSIKSEALIFYPGGLGTLNELFEFSMLMQTDIVDKVPIICVNTSYWKDLFSWLKDKPLPMDFFIQGKQDLQLLNLVDDVQEIIELIEKVKPHA